MSLKAFYRYCTIIAIVAVCCSRVAAQNPDWEKPYDPFRIAGNLYYVGTYDIGCYLITTPQGHILINTGMKSTVPMIRAHVEALGFKFSDIKILLSSQAHYDHVGGMAAVQEMTGAKVMIDEQDVAVMNDGGNSDFLFGGKGVGSMFEPVKTDRALHDQDIIALGGMKIKYYHHGGHTRGSGSYLFDVQDKGKKYTVLIANMPTVLDETNLASKPSYPGIAADYAHSLSSLKAMKFDLWLCAHASQFSLQEKHKNGDGYNPEAFRDRKEYDTELAEIKQKYKKKLKE